MAENHFDVVVIGSGPGGEGAALKVAKAGKRVAIVERHSSVGGGCTHWGTIPSKALRQAVWRMEEYNNSPLYRGLSEQKYLTFPEILRRSEEVIAKQVRLRGGFYSRNRVEIIRGNAHFTDPNTLTVTDDGSQEQRVTFDQIIIASGSRPYRPSNIDFNHPLVHDSDTILGLEKTPRSLIIYGAGVIGCEYASIFRALGVKVDLIDTRERLLAFLDHEISDALSYHLRANGVVVRSNEIFESLESDPQRIKMKLKSGKIIAAEMLLWANGRTGNTDALNLEAIGLEANSRGQLDVDNQYRTTVPHIYAVGDVIGYPSLASAAYDQGRFAATAIIQGECHDKLAEHIPTGIYTIPEISSIGRNEAELSADKIPYEVGYAHFKDLARAQISGETVGMLKILFHRDTLELLGVHCFGDHASEIIHIGQLLLTRSDGHNTIEYFVTNTFNYPTMAEAYRVAALNGLNRIQ